MLVCVACVALAACTAEPQHLILITVDTLRADHVGMVAGVGAEAAEPLTPHLDALARESLKFSHAYAPTSFTLPSVATLLTGRYPDTLEIRLNTDALDSQTPTLATRLAERGFRTGAVVSNFILRPASGLERGFDLYDAEFDAVEANRSDMLERRAASTTDAALAMLDELVGPAERVFLWVHYQDPHGPYSPPAGERERYLAAERAKADGRIRLPLSPDVKGHGGIPTYQYVPGEREPAYYRAGYKGEVHYADREIGRLLRGLDERGLRETAAVIFAADHGEGLGENDYWFAHGGRITDPLVRVPLFVRSPGLRPGTRGDAAGLVDVYETALRLLGVGPVDTSQGRDLLARGAADDPYRLYLTDSSSLGVVTDGLHYTVEGRDGSARTERLARLGGTAVDLDAALRSRMRRELLLALEESGAASAMSAGAGKPRARRPLSREDRERLRALGYVD